MCLRIFGTKFYLSKTFQSLHKIVVLMVRSHLFLEPFNSHCPIYPYLQSTHQTHKNNEGITPDTTRTSLTQESLT